MDKEIKYMIRYSKKKWLEEIVNGKIRFAPAETYVELEKSLQQKGRGDSKEGRFELKNGYGEVKDLSSGKITKFNESTNIMLTFEHLSETPIFCLTYYDQNSITDFITDKNYSIKLEKNNYECIRKDFIDADYALIILEPEKFINDIKNITGHSFTCDKIHYFNDNTLDKIAYICNFDKKTINFYKEKEFHITKTNVHKYLFCKDPYFKNQFEYRFLNLDLSIEEPCFFNFKFTSKYMIIPIEKLENNLKVIY